MEKMNKYKRMTFLELLRVPQNELAGKDQKPRKKRAMKVNAHFSEKKIGMALKHMKRHSLVIRKIQINLTVRHDFIPTIS